MQRQCIQPSASVHTRVTAFRSVGFVSARNAAIGTGYVVGTHTSTQNALKFVHISVLNPRHRTNPLGGVGSNCTLSELTCIEP